MRSIRTHIARAGLVAAAFALATTAGLSGCSKKDDGNKGAKTAETKPEPPKPEVKKGPLTIWINGDKGYNGLAKVGEKFKAATGVEVIIEHPEGATDKFQQAAAAGKGPDIFIWPHDRLGEWQSGGLVAEVKPGAKVKAAVEQKGWDAFTIGGKVWGYPIAFEAVGLIYNTELVPEPPKTFEEIIALDKVLKKDKKKAILWHYTESYFTMPLLMAQGGYAFQRNDDGTYDEASTGINNEGAVKGLAFLVQLINKGVIPKGAGYAEMESGMAKGEIAMIINGPWGWANLDQAKIKYAVAPLPTLGGEPAKPFVGVLGAMVNQASGNKELAIEFLENYLLTDDGLEQVNNDKSIGVPALKSFYTQLASDPRIAATMENVKVGVLMPNTPAMGKFWSAIKPALENATQGRQKPKEALDAAAARMMSDEGDDAKKDEGGADEGDEAADADDGDEE